MDLGEGNVFSIRGYCEVIDILCDIELSDVDKLLFSMQLFE